MKKIELSEEILEKLLEFAQDEKSYYEYTPAGRKITLTPKERGLYDMWVEIVKALEKET